MTRIKNRLSKAMLQSKIWPLDVPIFLFPGPRPELLVILKIWHKKKMYLSTFAKFSMFVKTTAVPCEMQCNRSASFCRSDSKRYSKQLDVQNWTYYAVLMSWTSFRCSPLLCTCSGEVASFVTGFLASCFFPNSYTFIFRGSSWISPLDCKGRGC